MTTIRLMNVLDDRLKVYQGLTNHQLRNRIDPERGICIVESETAIRVALEEGVEPLSFLLNDRKLHAMEDVLEGVDESVPIYVLPEEQAERITGYRVTRGALCAMRRPSLPSMNELLGSVGRAVVLEGMSDAANVGATFRNAAALGADAVVVAPNCADPFCRRSVRVSMGNVFRVPWTYASGAWPAECMESMRRMGFARIALALRNDAVALSEVRSQLPEDIRIALFLGAEGPGLAKRTIAGCDMSVVIPMARNVDSLNVAAAGAVAMWEVFR